MVLLYHYTFRGYASDHMTVMPYPHLSCCTKYGYIGVDLFFIVSGFVVLLGTASQGSPVRFLIARIVRLYPTFWVCCTTTFLVTLLIGGKWYTATLQQYLVNLTMLSGFTRVPSIDGAYWALFVEIKFYLLVFAILAFGVIRYWEGLLGLWLALSLFLDIAHVRYLNYLTSLLMPEYSPYFIAGAGFYLIYRFGISWYRVVITAIACALGIWTGCLETSKLSSHFATPFSPAVVAVILGSFFLIFLLMSAKRVEWLSTSRWLILGGLTYPLYLVHQNVGYMFFNVLYPSLNVHLIMWATVLLMLLFAYAVHRVVEQRYASGLKRLFERFL